MKKSTKALLHSFLVIPGGGYFLLGAKKRGVTFVAAAIILIAIISVDSSHKAQTIAQGIVEGKMSLGIMEIREQIATTPGLFTEGTIGAVAALLLALWVVGIVDTWRLGRRD
ncbi:MAG: hypothetical protein ACI9DH_000180 [Halioglobus sp.]|jgi:hypothetical protein